MKVLAFQKEKILGEGSYGKVYKTRRLNDNQVYAMKSIDLNRLNFREIEDAVNEIRLMASINSPFILSFYEAFAVEDEKRLCIVTEYAKLGDLSHLIERRKLKNLPLKEEQIWQFFLEILEGLRILHSCGVVHRDLKSANILLAAPDLVKIGDLGIATVLHKTRFSHEMAKTQIGTPLYLAPEIWKKCPYDEKCDIWSLGILLYEMMTFSFPFSGRMQSDLQRRICSGFYSIPSVTDKLYSKDLINVLKSLLMVNPNDRPSVEQLLNMQSVKSHMDLLNPFLQKELFRNTSLDDLVLEGGNAKLLSTIHVPRGNYCYDRYGRRNLNLNSLQLPSQKYNKRPPVIVPIDDRIVLKKGNSKLKNFSKLSTPDLKFITDQDLWMPNKEVSDKLRQIHPSYSVLETKKNTEYEDETDFSQNFMVNKSPRKLLPPIENEDKKQDNQQDRKISPRLIPTRYRYLYKPLSDLGEVKYQDPRWKRKIPSLKKQNHLIVNDNSRSLGGMDRS